MEKQVEYYVYKRESYRSCNRFCERGAEDVINQGDPTEMGPYASLAEALKACRDDASNDTLRWNEGPRWTDGRNGGTITRYIYDIEASYYDDEAGEYISCDEYGNEDIYSGLVDMFDALNLVPGLEEATRAAWNLHYAVCDAEEQDEHGRVELYNVDSFFGTFQAVRIGDSQELYLPADLQSGIRFKTAAEAENNMNDPAAAPWWNYPETAEQKVVYDLLDYWI